VKFSRRENFNEMFNENVCEISANFNPYVIEATTIVTTITHVKYDQILANCNTCITSVIFRGMVLRPHWTVRILKQTH